MGTAVLSWPGLLQITRNEKWKGRGLHLATHLPLLWEWIPWFLGFTILSFHQLTLPTNYRTEATEPLQVPPAILSPGDTAKLAFRRTLLTTQPV